MMRASPETPPPDERDLRFDAAASQFAAPLARLARSLEDEQPGRSALSRDLHFALWDSLADYDAGTPLRDWVFREALRSVAAHEPNSQDKDIRNLPIKVVWSQRRLLRAQRWLAEMSEPAASAIGLLRALKPIDREPVILFLEGLDPEEAARITGWPLARLQQAYQRIESLLPPATREAWQRQDSDAEPVSREDIRLRRRELQHRKGRETRAQFLISMVLGGMLVVKALMFYRHHWLTPSGLLLLAGVLVFDGMRARRQPPEAPTRAARHPDSRGFHRDLLTKQRDELRRGYSWQSWLLMVGLCTVLIGYPLIRAQTLPWVLASLGLGAAALAVARYRDRREAHRLQERLESL